VTRLSIVIPVLGNAADLERTLVSVLEHRPRDCEIIPVLNAPYDDPYDVKGEVRFIAARSGAGFVECVNTGIRASRGKFIHVLLAGLEATENWTDSVLEQFTDPRVAAVAPLIVKASRPKKALAAGVRYRRTGDKVLNKPKQAQAGNILAPCGVAAFYRKSAVDLAGGLPTYLGDELADVQLGMQLRAAAWTAVFDPHSLIKADAISNLEPSGFRRGFYAERLFWLHAKQFGLGASVLVHPWSVLAQFVTSLPSLGAVTGLCGRLFSAASSLVRTPRAHSAPATETPELPDGYRLDSAHQSSINTGSVKQSTRVSGS